MYFTELITLKYKNYELHKCMGIYQEARGLLLVYVTLLSLYAVFFFIELATIYGKMQPSEQQPKSPEEIELHPYEPDANKAR